MKLVIKISFLLFFVVGLSKMSWAQEHKELKLRDAPMEWVNLIQGRYDKFTKDSFLVYHNVSKLAARNTELPVMVQLFKGRLYHFMVFADPSVKKVEMKLGKRGVGHIITDKFYPTRDGEVYTDFTYVCSKTGYYLLTIFQRGGNKQQYTHVGVLQRKRDENRSLEFGYD